jgi:predicted glycosyltransferase involved in capsule biosynthesis
MTNFLSIDVIIPISGIWRIIYLKNCIKSVLGQRYPNNMIHVTIVHISSPSEDNDITELSALCRDIEASLVFTKLKDPAFSRSRTLNIGARAGSMDVVALFDCDVFFHKQTFEYALGVLLSGRAAVVPVARTRFCPLDDVFRNTVTSLDDVCEWNKLGDDVRDDAHGNIMVPRRAFENIRGLDERYYGWGGEDNDLFFRLRDTIGVKHLKEAGCPKSLHQNHPLAKDVESDFTRRNRLLLGKYAPPVRNEGEWGGIVDGYVLEH